MYANYVALVLPSAIIAQMISSSIFATLLAHSFAISTLGAMARLIIDIRRCGDEVSISSRYHRSREIIGHCLIHDTETISCRYRF